MRGKVDLTRILDLIFHPTPVNDAMDSTCSLPDFIFIIFENGGKGSFFCNGKKTEHAPSIEAYGSILLLLEATSSGNRNSFTEPLRRGHHSEIYPLFPQPLADGFKLIIKEPISPSSASIRRTGEYKKVIREAHRPINRISGILEFGMKRGVMLPTIPSGNMSGPFSMDLRIIHPCGLFIMYSSISLFQESYISFSNIGGRLSAPERIALLARVSIERFGGKKKTKAMVFHKMDTKEVSDRFVAPCFVNGLEAYDGEINLGVDENMISNEYIVKLCLEYKVKIGNKIVKKELIVALRGEIYFVKFIINPEEDDIEPRVIFERSFLRMTKEITDFGARTITIYPDIDPFLEDIKEEEKVWMIGTRKSNRNKKRAMENIKLFYQDIGSSSSARRHLTQEEVAKEALEIRISQKFALLEELGRKEIKKVDRGIIMINHTQAEAMGILTNVLCQVGVTTLISKFCHQTFRAARSDVLRTAESDSDDEEEYEIKKNKFGAPIYGLKPAPCLNCNVPVKRSLALQTVTNLFRNNSVWKKALVSLEETMLKPNHQDPNALENLKQWKKCCFHKFNMSSYFGKVATMRRSLGCDGEIDDMLRIKLRKAESNEEIFTSMAWIRAFNIKEPIYAELCHEFYSTYEFDEVCVEDELQTNKIIKFRLGGRAHNITLLEFARRLGLYHADELEDDGFDVYFQGGLRSDEHFNAQEYWLSISREENLGLSRSHTFTIRSQILRVIHKMITYGLCQRTIGYDKIQKNDLWLLSLFDARHQNGYANVAWLIARWMKRKGADLDTTTLKELINSEGRLKPEDLQPGVPRVGILRPSRASIQDLYDRTGSMEIRQEAIERMEYRQSYHWDMYQEVFKHMAGVYNVPL
uniref:Retrotransposon Orf1 n=1 Tax=Tanacetum cinerariifolium TaxID=118510 RepID=A0A6L2N5W2_TANCI|nr:retrotransposon Orf1 [Tanacetum cinerariifolium]